MYLIHNSKGQRDRQNFFVPGQRDNGTSSKSCHGTGFFETVPSLPGTTRRTKWPSILHIYAIFRKKKVIVQSRPTSRPGFWLSRPVPWQDFELVPLSLCPGTKNNPCPVVSFVPGKSKDVCAFVPRDKKILSRWKP